MYSSPWLAVAVYVRAPVAEAPIIALIAANSDSTLRNSHRPRSPRFTIAERPSTMCVCGEIGYAQMTSGRHIATAAATAWEPSICLSTGELRSVGDDGERGLGRTGVALAHLAGELLANRRRQRGQRDDLGERDESAEERRVGERAADVLARQHGRGQGERPVAAEALHEIVEAERGQRALGVDKDI